MGRALPGRHSRLGRSPTRHPSGATLPGGGEGDRRLSPVRRPSSTDLLPRSGEGGSAAGRDGWGQALPGRRARLGRSPTRHPSGATLPEGGEGERCPSPVRRSSGMGLLPRSGEGGSAAGRDGWGPALPGRRARLGLSPTRHPSGATLPGGGEGDRRLSCVRRSSGTDLLPRSGKGSSAAGRDGWGAALPGRHSRLGRSPTRHPSGATLPGGGEGDRCPSPVRRPSSTDLLPRSGEGGSAAGRDGWGPALPGRHSRLGRSPTRHPSGATLPGGGEGDRCPSPVRRSSGTDLLPRSGEGGSAAGRDGWGQALPGGHSRLGRSPIRHPSGATLPGGGEGDRRPSPVRRPSSTALLPRSGEGGSATGRDGWGQALADERNRLGRSPTRHPSGATLPEGGEGDRCPSPVRRPSSTDLLPRSGEGGSAAGRDGWGQALPGRRARLGLSPTRRPPGATLPGGGEGDRRCATGGVAGSLDGGL